MPTKITFNGITKPWLYGLEGRQKSPFPPVNNNLLRVTGMDGAHIESSNDDVLYITQPIGFLVNGDEDALTKKDELADWLVTDEPVELQFSDEPGRIYYAKVDGSISDFSRFANQRKGTITFICPDPYGYSQEKQAVFPSDYVTITNDGTAEADPIFILEVTNPITFAMIQNQNDEYMMIGQPVDDDKNIIDDKFIAYQTNGADLHEWGERPPEEQSEYIDPIAGGVSNGTFAYDGTGIIVDDFGDTWAGRSGYGPAIFKSLDTAIQDFELEAIFDTRTDWLEENFRMEIYLFDEGNNNLGKIGIRDRLKHFDNRNGLARVGHYEDERTRYMIGTGNYDHNDLGKSSMFFLRWRRKGKLTTFYIAEIVNGKHVNTIVRTFNDSNNEWMGKVKYIQLFIRSWKDRRDPYLARVNSLRLFELNEITEDNTPYIAYPGDVITFDHKNEEILLNGEDATELKQFGADYFKLNKRQNELVVHPSNSFAVGVEYRERYK